MKIWNEGDRSKGLCESCRRLVETRFERRDFPLVDPPIVVPDVLVACCIVCGSIVAVPPQSSPRINAARSASLAPVQVRLTQDHADLLGMVASQFVSRPNRAFEETLLNHYLEELDRRPELVAQMGRLAAMAEPPGRASTRRTFHLVPALLDRAASKAEAVGLSNRSAMVRALIEAMAEDVEQPSQKLQMMRKCFPDVGSLLCSTKT